MKLLKSFLTNKHGMAFKNSFRISLGFGSSATLGLCGGMCCEVQRRFTGLNYRPNLFCRQTIPAFLSVDFIYLFVRQLQSLFSNILVGLLKFQYGLKLEPINRRVARDQQIALIETALVQGRLVRLCLIKQCSPLANPFNNHQVLVYAIEKRPEGVVILYLYDPNYPLRTDILLYTGHPQSNLWYQSSGEHWAFLFVVVPLVGETAKFFV